MTADLRWYLTSMACFLVPGGIQAVLFPYLVAVELQESPERVGLAQMASQLPMLLLILWGGLLGDRVDQRTLLIRLQLAMILPPLLMAVLIGSGQLRYELLLAWAMVGGTFAAFAQPARDALLNRVAGDRVQRVVTMAVGVQFGVQILGFGIGSMADVVGAPSVLAVQGLLLGAAAMTTRKISRLAPVPPRMRRHPVQEIAEGISIAWRSPVIRPAIVLTFAIGVFFAGTYLVLLPLMVRDLYSASAGGIAGVFAANMAGTCTMIVLLMRRGGVARPGRALLIGGACSVTILALLHLDLPEGLFYLVVYLWGLCGGISMTMSRSIVQEASPESHRARLMSVYSLGMMGGMPIGSLLLGWCAGQFGVRNAILVPVAGMAVVLVGLALGSRLWSVLRQPEPEETGAPAQATG